MSLVNCARSGRQPVLRRHADHCHAAASGSGARIAIDISLRRDETVAQARTSIASRYALRELNSFVITAVDHLRHGTDSSLDLYDEQTGQGAMRRVSRVTAKSLPEGCGLDSLRSRRPNHCQEDNNMAFINEYIPPADLVKYEIEKIDKQYVVGGTSARDWTIDRERDVYLRNVAAGREENASRLTWTLYWKGSLIRVETETIKIDRGASGQRHAHKRVRRIDIPDEVAEQRVQIVSALREALLAYKDGGVFSTSTHYTLTLDI